MKIGVISDTHIPRRAKALPLVVWNAFQDVDMILHAGDLIDLLILETLEKLAPVHAVYGNVDPPEIRERLPKKIILEAGRFHIGLVHGDGAGGKTPERAFHTFKNEGIDCVVFGHSHIPYMETIHEILLFNPGSPTDKRRQARFSYGILEIAETLSAEICYFEDKTPML